LLSRITPIALAAALSISLTAVAEYKAPTEAQCREMVSGMMQAMRSTTPVTEEDKKRHAEYLARLEKKLAEIRARGGGECELWAAIADHVTK
jgi:hypothetical protein